MQKLQNLWAKLDGKKTTLGAVIMFLGYGALGIGLIDQQTFDMIANIGEIILGVGLTHKVMKVGQ